jgi:hypothetical protein
LLSAVRKIVKQIMIAALFAVAMLGGGEVPILHAPQFADAHALAHQHVDHAAPGYHDHVPADLAANADQDGDNPLQHPDRGCTHAHAHCCCAAALTLVANDTSPPTSDLGLLRFDRNAAVPYGQLSIPPLRPPRLAA